ncbi:MAG TPA: NF038122 family metalloprotease [Blastocatellia bacterium]|nr:NF038122 family metalloprotease [Blastocatellia bacterium]
MVRRITLRFKLLFLTSLLLSSGLPATMNMRAAAQDNENQYQLTGVSLPEGCVLYSAGGEAACRQADQEESLFISNRVHDPSLNVISPVRQHQQEGLTIVLRATEQLESFPQAKAAFLKAAALWESHIQTPMTVIVDVDFGSTWFGFDYPENVIGMTNPQVLVAQPFYQMMHRRLLDTASSQHELSLYESLPAIECPTDMGGTRTVYAPSAVFRAQNFINPVAEPTGEPPSFGPPPAIGFNSAFSYDFDPSDGIDSDKIDFDAVATHELGHVLGFISVTGRIEIDPSLPVGVSVWDVFRVRFGATMESFPTDSRILSSGGDQFFYVGDQEMPLSTGRPDGTGGDGRQASHWKDDSILNHRIGIMDPTLPLGKRQTVTLNDLEALDLFGYRIKPVGNNRPAINSLEADLVGELMTISGTSTDLDGDIVQAQVKLIDNKGQTVGETAPFAVDFGIPANIHFTIPFGEMGRFPSVVKVGLTLIDSLGNRSETEVADFTGGDAAGPKISKATLKGEKLTLKGKRMGGNLQVEINGIVVAPPAAIAANGKKLTVKGQAFELNLQSGANRVRVISNGLRSNLLVITL